DAGFGDGDGFVTYNSNITDWAYAVAVDPSDRIVVGGGLSMSASDMDLFVMRLKNNGVLDATFSSDGLITHSATAGCNGIEKAYTVIANGGEIFAGGTGLNCGSKGDSTLLKITGEGKLDTNFDAEGVASTEGYRESYQEYGQAVAQNTATGKIYLAGYQKASTGYSDMAIWGFNADGTPDTSFGTDGVLTTTADFADKNRWTAAGDDFIQGAAVDSQGRIVAAGYSTWAAGFSPMLVVWRFNADGTLDATFSDDGFYWAYSASNGDQKGHAVIVDSSNNIVVAGEQNNTMALWLFDANGKLTASASDSANEGVGHAVAFDSSGRILIAGKRENSSTGDDDMAIWRYNPDGNPDASFGTNGVFMTKASGDDVGNGMALDSSGNIFVVGQSTDASGNTRATVWLYDVTKGRLDTNFDGDGVWVDTGGAGDKSEAYSAAYDGDGFLVTGAGNVTETTQDFALWYFASTGIDKTFGNAGLILKSGSTGGKMDAGYSVMFDLASKKILVGGSSQDADNSSRGAVWRLY
ncbi:MAG: SBBP repeat-containing protein, partial [Deltaproteobacteria bacterium]|nr:SBBP repeat-containing protein [Deltaproteobacteria bacterium]